MTSSSSDTDCSQFMFQQLYIHAKIECINESMRSYQFILPQLYTPENWIRSYQHQICYTVRKVAIALHHSSMEGIARHSYRQNLRWDSDWIDFMMFGIWILQELLHWLLYSYWCVILLRSHTDSLHWRGKDMKLHLTSQQLLNLHELLMKASLPGRGPRPKQFVMPRYAYRAEV